MKKIVVDSSVVIKWYIPEEHEAEASELLDSGCTLIAPDLVVSEIGNILWKKIRRKEISLPEAKLIVNQLTHFPFILYSSSDIWQFAFDLAVLLGRTVYDCLYLALALMHSCKFITADRKFHNALQQTELAKSVCWLGNLSSNVLL